MERECSRTFKIRDIAFCEGLDHIYSTCSRKIKQRCDTGCWKCEKDGHMERETVQVIDTGANVTLVRADVFQKLYPKPAEVRMKPISLHTATGEKARVHHCVLLSILIGSNIFHHKSYNANILDECIIDLVVLRQFGFSIDIERNLLRTSDENIPLLTSQQLRNFQACRTGRNTSKGVNIYDSARAIKKDSCFGNEVAALLIKRNHSLMARSRRVDIVPDNLPQVWKETKKELQPRQGVGNLRLASHMRLFGCEAAGCRPLT
ncbi:hypothetical protein LAZ67_7001322 [Cordylochernes scorpioides]|uniref:Peptidase A2 domain-containing protein n=1 Tax=Cordylochernes scorpioides TaxID=51811 RepID=A0ABY6KM68_9ARAC|nr:hypothetical protein LAZ67_7001322 [Cordylochernes scorpioides]